MKLDYHRAAAILMDALVLGDVAAAKKWGICRRTVENYRARARKDPVLDALVEQKRAVEERDWRAIRLRFLQRGVAKLDELVAMATGPEHIRDVAEAVRIIGEFETVREALHVGTGDDRQGAAPAQAAGGTGAPAAPPTPGLQ